MNSETGNDIEAENLAKAIRQRESGGNFNAVGDAGTSHGGYQFQQATWKRYAKDVLGNENAEMTPANQNAVAYGKIKTWKDGGKNAAQIAAMWNAGEGIGDKWVDHKGKTTINGKVLSYDTPQYVKDVTDLYQKYKSQTPATQSQTNNPNKKEITGNENGLQAGLNALKNTPKSAVGFAKGVVHSVTDIPSNVAQIPNAFSELSKEKGGTLPAIGATLKEIPGQLYKGLVPQAIRQLISGDTQGASKSIQEDPFGTVAPLVFAAEGGAKLADNLSSKSAMKGYVKNIGENTANRVPIPKPTTKYSDAFNTGVEKTAGLITKPVGAITGKVGNVIGGIKGSLASQITGLDPQTIQQIISNPKEFSKIAQDNASRGGLAGEVGTAISERLKGLEETGKEYDPIRSQSDMISDTTTFIEDILAKNGLRLEKGKITADSTSTTRNTADLRALQDFYNNWGKRVGLTPSEFLNMRSDLADLAKYDKLTGNGKTAKSQIIADQLRQQSNKVFRPKVKGLKELDSKFSEEKQFLKQIKKDYLNPDGTFKDGAVNKIANATGVGKDNLLNRLEQVVPGITKRIQILKAVEDIERANGIKVGTYTRGMLQGGAILAGNIPMAIISTILTHPANAVKILRAAGYTGAKLAPVLEILRTLGGKVNNLPTKALYSGMIENNLTR